MSKIVLFKNGSAKENDYNSREDEFLNLQKTALKQPSENEITDGKEPEVSSVVPLKVPDQQVAEGKNSFIERGIVITGSVSSVTNIEIFGTINGNVTCENDVFISGCVTGNVAANNIQISAGRVKGDIECKNAVQISKNSEVKGNIKGESLECDGKIEGSSKITGKAEITSNAVILGDIDASKISIEDGVEFIGKLQVSMGDKSRASN